VRPAAEVNGGGGAPVFGGGEEEVGKLQGGMGKLSVGPIGVEEGRRGVLHGEQKAAASGDRRHTSGSRCDAQRDQLRGRRASWGRCGAAGVPGWGQEALQQRGDGKAKRAAEQELVGVVVQLFQWKKLKLVCSVSFGGSWGCCLCFGSGMGSSGGGCRR
jgi:hypothetical protein